MEPGEVIGLFDSCWFNLEIFRAKSTCPGNLERNPTKLKYSSLKSILMRSKSDELSSLASLNHGGSGSPTSVLFTQQIQTIISGKETSEPSDIIRSGFGEREVVVHLRPERTTEDSGTEQGRETPKKSRRRTREKIGKKGTSKSFSDLEFEELRGFMDLGFVFSEEDRHSSLAEIIPGLQMLGKERNGEERESGGGVDESGTVVRPYLSEAWGILERSKKENPPLMNWRVPDFNNENDMKDGLRLWAQNVASVVR